MMYGYMGKILWIDLSDSKIWKEDLDPKDCRDFLGGYGLGARILYSRQIGGVDPLGPENILGFVTGPTTGTKAPFCGRYTVVGKSPLTGTWGDANSGGDFGPYLKFSGFDAVFLKGISEKPVYLYLENGSAELRYANHLWGKDTIETEEAIRSELGKDTRVACIGPAGEKLSLIAGVINNKGRAAARSGLGAVMGSKRLKAIAVRGGGRVAVAREDELLAVRKKLIGSLKDNPWYFFFHDVGTCGMVPDSVAIGRTPVKNWGGSIEDFPEVEKISGLSLVESQKRRYGCWNCPMACGGHMKEGRGKYKYREGAHKPEYETVGAFGTMCLNKNLDSIILANEMCNRYGIDTISVGGTIAFAIECYENGLINKQDTDGLELTWGNHEAIISLTEKIGRREGFGDLLADGVKIASERIGSESEEYAVHVHGQELPMHDPRSQIRLGLGATYKAAPNPGRHTRGSGEGEFRHPDIGEHPYDLTSFEGRGGEHKRVTCLLNSVSSSGLCLFGYLTMKLEATQELLNCVTGWDLGFDDLIMIGERISNIQQAFNLREGLNPIQFKVPRRMFKTNPPYDGPLAGRHCDVDLLVKDWYEEMDWAIDTGKPSKRKLEEMGLEEAVGILYP